MPARDLALILIICTVWAGNFIAGSFGMQHFSPFLFMILRFALLLLILLPFLRRPPPGQWPRLIAVCLLIGGLHFTLLFGGAMVILSILFITLRAREKTLQSWLRQKDGEVHHSRAFHQHRNETAELVRLPQRRQSPGAFRRPAKGSGILYR